MKKINTAELKNTLKQGTVISFLVSEILLNLMLFYPLSFAVSLAEGQGGISLIQVIAALPVISGASGLLYFLTKKPSFQKIVAWIFLLTKSVLLVYIVRNLFYSWFGWVLILLIACSGGLVFKRYRREYKV